jgi:hypothetical protein
VVPDLLERSRDELVREREELAVKEKERLDAANHRLEERARRALTSWLGRWGVEVADEDITYRGPHAEEDWSVPPRTRLVVGGVTFGYSDHDPDGFTYPLVARVCELCGAEVLERADGFGKIAQFLDGDLRPHHTGESRDGEFDEEYELCDGIERWYDADRRPKREVRPRYRIAEFSAADRLTEALQATLEAFEEDGYTPTIHTAGETVIVVGGDARGPEVEPF